MKKIFLTLLSAGLLLTACNSGNDAHTSDSVTVADNTTVADPAHNSRNAVDWQGTYKGVLPCADCPGIDVTLTLNENGTYVRETKYQGDKAASMPVDKEEGSFTWSTDGQKITLNNITDGSNQYFVGENMLYTLDAEGNRVEGELAETYILKK